MMSSMNKDKRVFIHAGIKLLSKSAVLKYIPEDVYDEIKSKDTDPMFIMCSVGNEGSSKGELLVHDITSGQKVKNWYKQLWPLKAIKQIVTKMKEPSYLPMYEAHEPGSPNRDVVGSIIAATKKVLKNSTHAIAIGYVNNYGTRKKIESGEFDACSLEANCVFERADNILRWIVRDVKELFGIALCNSEKNPPGFDDSRILAVVTAMAVDDDDDDDKGHHRKRADIMNIQEVKDYIRAHSVTPSALYSVVEMTKDPQVKDAFDNELKTKTDEFKKKNDELEKELVPLRTKAANGKVVELIKGSELLKNEYKEVVEYLSNTLKISVEGIDNPQPVIDAAIKTQLEVMAKANFKTKTAEGGDDDDDKNKGEEDKNKDDKNKKTDENADKNDMTNPENNDLIP